jgi:CheY-like chemotaxis protein
MHTLDATMNLQSLILVVDDDPDLRKLITGFLSGHGYRVASAENVAEMRRSIEAERPDLVILDAMMPGEDGLSAARSLAAERGPAVIMLSALGSDTDRIIGLEVGADDLAIPGNCWRGCARSCAGVRWAHSMPRRQVNSMRLRDGVSIFCVATCEIRPVFSSNYLTGSSPCYAASWSTRSAS